MKIIRLEPGQKAFVDDIPEGLESMQAIVGGYIEAVYPFRERIALVCNEEGKLRDMPFNRVLRDEEGHPYDAILGPAFIVGLSEENFQDIPEELVEKYLDMFHLPEYLRFTPFGTTLVVRYDPEKEKGE